VGFVSSDKSREYALLQALRPFAAGHYQQAGQALDTFLMAYPNDPIASQYRAITLLEQGDAIGAAQLLSPLSQDRSFPYQETAQWYLALSYLHLNDPAHTLQACALLRDLAAKPSGDYQQEAIQLLQQLS
jgi:predicted Zn-dependent protease